jgi:hypothetical protein
MEGIEMTQEEFVEDLLTSLRDHPEKWSTRRVRRTVSLVNTKTGVNFMIEGSSDPIGASPVRVKSDKHIVIATIPRKKIKPLLEARKQKEKDNLAQRIANKRAEFLTNFKGF